MSKLVITDIADVRVIDRMGPNPLCIFVGGWALSWERTSYISGASKVLRNTCLRRSIPP
jgi:hypothetical protein